MAVRRRRLLISLVTLVCMVGVLGTVPQAVGTAAPSGPALIVTDVRTEYAHNPVGLDVAQPRMSWVLESAERGQQQTAYQIVVSREADGGQPVWDSGKVASAQSVNVAYDGAALQSAARYYWKVKVWDKHGAATEWSRTAWWEMGLVDAADWQAEWIGGPPSDSLALDGAMWIWFPEGNPGEAAPAATRYFRHTFTVPEGKALVRARALLTADNQFEAYVNGAKTAESDGTVSAWQHAVAVELTDELHAGENTLAIAATNADGAAGLIGGVELTFADGSSDVLRTGDQWKALDAEATGWTDPSFDDSQWPAALEIAPYGEGVWTCCGGVQIPAPDPLLRKTFRITKPVEQARVYMSGLGYHELRLNGSKVGDRVLETDVNDYAERVDYTTYDVTSYLEDGDNAVGVMLGRGLYDANYDIWQSAPWRDRPKLLLQMEIRYADGTTATVVSDESWKTTFGPITDDSFNGGEDYDARLEQPGWDKASFDDTRWQVATEAEPPSGRLDASNNDPVKVNETLRPVGTTEPEPGVYVLDMGHTITGWARLRVSAEAGTTITVRYGQKLLSDGTVDFAGWKGGSQTDSYTARGGRMETWEPRFSFKSFRYVEVSGLPSPPRAYTVLGRSVHSAVLNAGEFRSSSDLYNAFHDGMRRTILGNLQGYPAVDPLYEKAGWTEDVFVAAQSMIYNFDLARFFTEWLDDIRDSQLPSGQIPIIVPAPDWGYESWGTPSPVWTAVYPIMAWRMYENYGDRRVLEDHYPAIKAYIDREVARLDDGIVSAEFLGDWLAPGIPGGIPPEDTRLAGTAYVYRQLRIVADMAGALGRAEDVAHYEEQARFVQGRFNASFLNAEKGQYETAQDPEYRQTSNLLPLAFGMVPAEYEKQVLDSVVADIRARGNHLNTGTLGTEVILPVLTENGYADLAHAVASQRTYPSWGAWYENGADTMWEAWELSARSRSHFFLGMIEEWLFEDVAGINAGAPGYEKTVIRAHLGGDLAEAKGKHNSVYGEIESEWEADDGSFTLTVTIPVNTTGTIYVPTSDPNSVTESGDPAGEAEGVRDVEFEEGYAVYEVGSGTYRFRSVL